MPYRKSCAGDVWSFGATADIVWLKSAFDALKLDFPFGYRAQKCLRTLTDLAGVPRPPEQGMKHHALADTLNQVVWAQLCFAALKKEVRHGIPEPA
jgi:hypothetical protein